MRCCDGDHYVVNGQKTWNTLGQFADWIFCLVRTDTGGQAAIRHHLFVDRHEESRASRCGPITLLDGGHEVNEIWFEDVKVPVENRIGEENKGWTYAKFLLGHERTNIAGIGGAKRELARLKRIAASERKNGRPLIEDPLFAAQIAQVEIDLWALEITNLRMLSQERGAQGAGTAGLDSQDPRHRDRAAHLRTLDARSGTLRAAVSPRSDGGGLAGGSEPREQSGPRYASTLAAAYMNLRKLSIFGGTNEIQKNIISKMIVGL